MGSVLHREVSSFAVESLTDSRQLAILKAALDALPGHVAILDGRGDILCVNGRWIEYAAQNRLSQCNFGIGQNYLAICRPAVAAEDADAQCVSRALEDILAGRSGREFIHEYLCPHPGDPSRDRWFKLWLIPFRLDAEQFVLVSHEDITVRHALERTGKLLDTAISQSRSGIMITNAAGEIEYVNQGFEQMTGYAAGEVVGRNPRLLKSGRISAATYADLWRTIGAGETWRGQVCNRRKDGEEYWEEMTISLVRDPAGVITHYVAVKEDITESRYRALLHAGIINASADAFVALDEHFRIVDWGKQAERILGWPAKKVVGREFIATVFDAERAREAQLELAVCRRGEFSRLVGSAHRTEMRRQDGSRVTVELWLTALSLQGEVRYAGFIRDLTESVRAEQILLEAQKMEGVGQMAGGLAHDFNNLLHLILGSLYLIADEVPAHSRSHLDNAMSAARHGAALVSSLATFVRRGESRLAERDVNQLIRALESLIRQTVGKRIALTVELQAQSSTVLIDENAFNNALINLAVNARDAMPRGGSLVIATGDSSAGGQVVVSVRDEGEGMPPEVIARATEAFFTTKPPGQGTGLGLAMVDGFCRHAGGRLAIDSAPGRGTAIELHLPVVRAGRAPGATP